MDVRQNEFAWTQSNPLISKRKSATWPSCSDASLELGYNNAELFHLRESILRAALVHLSTAGVLAASISRPSH